MMLYSFLLAVVLIVGAPYWLWRMAFSGRYRAGLGGRLGFIPVALRERVAAIRVERRGGGGVRPLMWIHAVSVGEVLAAARLIDELRTGEFNRLRPGSVFAVSTTTEAGQHLAKERLRDCAIFYFPLDFDFLVRRYLDLLNPEAVILMESELWPQLIAQCERRGVPVVVANARISDRSFPRYMRLRRLWRPVLAKVALFLAQSQESADRLKAIGASRVELTGNLKYDARPGKETTLVTALRSHIPKGVPVVVCGSTLEGEEAILLDAWPKVLQTSSTALLVIAPRRPDRFDQVSALTQSRGLTLIRASAYLRAQVALRTGTVVLLDTIGDLASLYAAATVAFVGGSLVGAGGHNPLEPAQFGVPVVMGPSFENFREIVEAMQGNKGIRIVNLEMLAEAVIEMLHEPTEAAAMGARGKAVSAAQSGAAARTGQAMLKLLPARSAAGGADRR